MNKSLILAFIISIWASSAFSQIAIVGNKNIKLEIKNVQELTDIFTLDNQKSADGTTLVLFGLKSDVKELFYQKLGKTSTELKKIWMKAQLSGDGKAPAFLDGDKDVISNVASTPGGIGFINETGVTPDVKVLYILK